MRQVIRADLDPRSRPARRPRRGAFPRRSGRRAARAGPSSENPGNASLSAAGADPGLGAGERKGRGGRSPVRRRRRPRACSTPICAAIRPPPGRCAPAWRCRAPRPPPKSCASTPTQPRCATCASPSATRSDPRRTSFALARPRRPAAQPRPQPARRRSGAARPGLSDPNGLAASLKACAGEGDPVSAAAKAAALAFSALPDAPAAEAEILALWVFDMRPRDPAALAAARAADRYENSGSRLCGRTGARRRPRPGDPAWPNAAAGAIALAAASALDLAADLARRSNTLIAVAPKLRVETGPENRRPAARPRLRLARRSRPPRADDRPRRPPPVRPARRARRRARAFRPAGVPAVRPMSAAARRRRRRGRRAARRRASRSAAGRPLARMDAARRSRDLRLGKTRAARGARPPGRPSLPVRRSDRRSHPRAARPPLRSHPRRRRLCACAPKPASRRRSAPPIPDGQGMRLGSSPRRRPLR